MPWLGGIDEPQEDECWRDREQPEDAHRERARCATSARAAWRSQTRLRATAGPSVNARVPKLMAVLLASCRAIGPGDASVGTNIASIRSDHGVRPPLLAATGTSQTSTQTGTTANATRRRRRLGSAVHTAHIQSGARKTVTSSRKPLAMPRSSAEGRTSQRCPRNTMSWQVSPMVTARHASSVHGIPMVP